MDEISHIGRIVGITPEYTTVEITSESACASCHARGFCGLGDSAAKAVQVPTSGCTYSVGDEVYVNLRRSMGHRAVWIAYVAPLVILLSVLLGLLSAGITELYSALAGFAAVGAYYFIVWLFRNKLKKEYIFYISGK